MGSNDMSVALAISIIALRNKRKGKEYPIEVFYNEILVRQGIVKEQTPDIPKEVEIELPPVVVPEEDSVSTAVSKEQSQSIHVKIAPKKIYPACKSQAKPSPKGMGLCHYIQVLKTIAGVESWQGEETVELILSHLKKKCTVREFSFTEVRNFFKIFNYVIKHQNSRENILILKSIMSLFKNLPESFYKKTRILELILQELKMSILEVMKYESGKFGKIQEIKFKIVLSFYNLVLGKCELPVLLFDHILEKNINGVITVVQELIRLGLERFKLLNSESVNMHNTELYRRHQFFQEFEDFKFSGTQIRLKLHNSLEVGVLGYQYIFYLVYYFLQILKLLLKNQSNIDLFNSRKLLLSSLIIYDDLELLEIYNELSWG